MKKIIWLVAAIGLRIGFDILMPIVRQDSIREQIDGNVPVNPMIGWMEMVGDMVTAFLLITVIIVMVPDMVRFMKRKIKGA